MSFNFHVAKRKQVLINSHRGDSVNCPENTMPAFLSAAEAGTSCIEIDIAMTLDNEFVVIHDPSIDRTSNGQGYVEKMTLAQLRAFDYGAWFDAQFMNTNIPTLREVLQWAVEHGIGLVVETKQRRRHQEFADVFCSFIKTMETHYPQVLAHLQLLSFDHQLINRVKSLRPDIKLQVVTLARYQDQLAAVTASNADCVCFEYPHTRTEDLRRYKQAGLCTRLYLPAKDVDTTLWFNRYYGYDVHGEIISWLKTGLIDMISHDDISMLKRLAHEAGIEPI